MHYFLIAEPVLLYFGSFLLQNILIFVNRLLQLALLSLEQVVRTF